MDEDIVDRASIYNEAVPVLLGLIRFIVGHVMRWTKRLVKILPILRWCGGGGQEAARRPPSTAGDTQNRPYMRAPLSVKADLAQFPLAPASRLEYGSHSFRLPPFPSHREAFRTARSGQGRADRRGEANP